MATVVHQKDKRSGITYAYESISHWDKDKKQSRAKRRLIGRVDVLTGEIVPTRQRKGKSKTCNIDTEISVLAAFAASKQFYGATYLFDEIGKKTGVTDDLRKCFPDTYKQILSIAYYLILEDKNPLSRFPKWSKTHKHPYQKDIVSQRSSELFASISEQERMHFFRLQARRRAENEYWAYDTTSFSSYSKVLKQVKYGVNKEHDPLPQLNIAIVFGEESNLPFYYKKLPGNISDVKTIKNLLSDLDFLSCKKIKLVLDRGFYSEDNINELYKNHLKFLIGAKLSLSYIKKTVNEHRRTIRSWENYNEAHELFSKTIPFEWNYIQKRVYKNDVLTEKRRMYIHVYFDALRAAEDERNFNKMLSTLQREIESGNRVEDNEKQYEKYFDIKDTPKRGAKVSAKQDAINEVTKNYGFFVLISNEVKDAIEALTIYRNKDTAEKAFGDYKERLDLRRLNVSSELSLEGKLFVEFVALIYLSYIKKQMQDKNLFRKYTMHEILDELDVIECFERKGRELMIAEVTKKQLALYDSMEIKRPISLC